MGQEVEDTVDQTPTETPAEETEREAPGADSPHRADQGGSTPPPATTPETPPAKKYKVKIDGKELEVDEEELVKGYQIEQAGRLKLQEAAEVKREVQEVWSLLDKDLEGALIRKYTKDYGSREKALEHLRQFGLGVVQKWMAEEEMSEEDKARLRRDQELAEREQNIRAQEAEVESAKEKELVRQNEEELEKEFPEVLKRAGLPDRPEIRARMLQWWLFSDEHGLDYSWDKIAKEVKRERKTGSVELTQTYSPDRPEDVAEWREINKAMYDAARKADFETLKRGGSTSQSATRQGAVAPQGQRRAKTPSEFRSWAEYARYKEEQFAPQEGTPAFAP